MALLDTLRSKRDFTDTDEAIASYVLDHADEVAEMSIAKLAAATHTSNAAIVRFCQKVGVEGYRAFRIELARELERTRNAVYEVNPDQPFLEGAGTRDIMSSIAKLSKQAVDATYASVESPAIQRAARLVRDARHVVLYATGDSRICALSFSNLLLKLGMVCTLGDQQGDSLVVSNFLGPKDVAIVISYSGTLANDENFKRGYDTLRAHGGKVIVISAYEDVDRLLPGAECTIRLPKSETRRGRIATYYSQACIRYVLNCIYGEIFSRTWAESMAARERYAQAAVGDL